MNLRDDFAFIILAGSRGLFDDGFLDGGFVSHTWQTISQGYLGTFLLDHLLVFSGDGLY